MQYSEGSVKIQLLQIMCELFDEKYGKTMPADRYDRKFLDDLENAKLIQVIAGQAMLTIAGYELISGFVKITYALNIKLSV